MPEIEIRPAVASDILPLTELDHSFATEHVWQMEFHHDREQGQINVNFRKVRLPRSVRYEVPRPARSLIDDWQQLSGLLVATLEEQAIGYTSLMLDQVTGAVWVADLVVDKLLRRQGIGSTLLLAAADWASTKNSHDIVLEIQPRNAPAVQMALKLGFEFCGYNDFYYPGNEIGFFFRRSF
jgi:GNAT superfamily N-acetyltransferase